MHVRCICCFVYTRFVVITKMSEEVILLSSDDETDNITKIASTTDDSQSTVNSDINAILEKYKTSTYIKYKSKPFETISSSSSDDDDNTIESLRNKFNRNNPVLETENENTNILREKFIVFDVDSEAPKTKKPKKNDDDKAQKKLEKEQERMRKQAERERIKAENAKTKQEKQKLALAYKNLKPEESIKFITALIDSELMSMECSTDIPTTLQNANITYRITSNLISSTVTWLRNNQPQLLNINGELQIEKNDNSCDEVLIIMLWNEFVKLVYEHEFTSNVQIKKELLNKKIFLGIYGVENYFRFHKSKKQKIPAKEKIYADAPKITRKEADMALIEIQLIFQISHRFLETPQDVSAIVLQFTKSIAQIPYKLQKEQQSKEMDWYVAGDKKDSVRVDKNGNGLHRLWQQQLTQFNLVRFEVAEAISSKYPSPTALIKAYEQCTIEEGEKLLQDIPIRRAAGPLTSARKIGPELSKKLYILFSSIDGNMDL